MTALAREADKEKELKSQFERSPCWPPIWEAYRKQMVQLEHLVDTQLKQLPNTHEVAGLLDDISFIATDNGLQIEQDQLGSRRSNTNFSTELPMRIEVVGTYHELSANSRQT